MDHPGLLSITLLPGTFAICKEPPAHPIPTWALGPGFLSITRTADELSIVCESERVPLEVSANRGWRAFKIIGPLDFSLTGVLSKVSSVLALGKVSIFAISTYETDYILVKEDAVPKAQVLLKAVATVIPYPTP